MTEKRNINYYAVDGLIMQGEHVDVNVPIKIALDHGWSSIKGEHIFMENLVTQVDYTPLTNNGLLEYRGRKYIIGQGRLGKQATKTENDNYFLLTIAGIAKELNYQKREKTTHVELYAGVPLTMFGAERKAFREYLWHKEQLSFNFEGVHYCFYLDKVKIYAQCYAAIANRMGDMNRLRCVDLGSWTMDVLSVKDKIPMDKDAYTYEVGLITAFERIKKDGLPKVHCEIPEEDITDRRELNLYVHEDFLDNEMNQVAEDYLNNTLENVEVHLVSIITYNENKKLKFDTETGIKNQIETIIAERYHLFDNNKIDVENNPILRRITYIVFPVWDLKGLVEEFQKMI